MLLILRIVLAEDNDLFSHFLDHSYKCNCLVLVLSFKFDAVHSESLSFKVTTLFGRKFKKKHQGFARNTDLFIKIYVKK